MISGHAIYFYTNFHNWGRKYCVGLLIRVAHCRSLYYNFRLCFHLLRVTNMSIELRLVRREKELYEGIATWNLLQFSYCDFRICIIKPDSCPYVSTVIYHSTLTDTIAAIDVCFHFRSGKRVLLLFLLKLQYRHCKTTRFFEAFMKKTQKECLKLEKS